MENEQKPLHVVSTRSITPGSPYETLLREAGQKDAEAKATQLAVHFPSNIQYFISSESSDDETRYYLNFKLEF